jgi:hypothetical protein
MKGEVPPGMMLRIALVMASILGPACTNQLPQDTTQVAIDQRCSSAAGPSDSYDLGQPLIDGNDLVIPALTGGGCQPHSFSLCWDGSVFDSYPPQVDLALRHDAHGDVCDALLTFDLQIDIAPVLTRFGRPLVINVLGASSQLEGTTSSVRIEN